ncbi:MAG: acyltransferase [Tildeniella torsiva UHER 1998/13D]|jgi:peptidoglycan/LPS O-acetylase OafA/YrhL|nr:acyltransferase [Tildeniella torsiva UHER 1998/13D]
MSAEENNKNVSIEHPKSSYRPEIDGLRAVAVIAVIINHFNKNWLPSGYLGVDIFFVISGFVITSSLANRHNKSLSDFLLSFYSRRIKRLVPALVLFVITTSILICLFNSIPKSSLQTGMASLFGLSNLYLLEQSTNYFASSTELNAFTHTWSLGVEEQFYFLFPFLVWFTGFGRLTTSGEKNLLWVTGSLSVVSLISFVFLYQIDQASAYFLMPTRFWELGLGCILFLGLKSYNVFSRNIQTAPSLLVIFGIISILFTPLRYAIPATVVVVLLTVVLIACLRPGTAGYYFFTQKQVVYIGLISYPLYLWHWGVLALSRWTIGVHWWSIPFQVALMLLLATTSYRYVETPLRHAEWSAIRWKSIGYGIFAAVVAALILISLNTPLGKLAYAGQKNNQSEMANVIETCGDISKTQKFLIVGDSHAEQISALFDSTPIKCIIHRETLSKGLYPTLNSQIGDKKNTPVKIDALVTHIDESSDMYRQQIDSLSSGDVLVISSRHLCRLFEKCFSVDLFEKYNRFFDDDLKEISESEAQDIYISKLRSLATKLQAEGVKVLVFLPMPEIRQMPQLCQREWFRPVLPSGCSVGEDTYKARELIVDKFNNALAPSSKTNIYLYDGYDLLCGPSKDCPNIIRRPDLMKDATHISPSASFLIHKDFISFLHRNNLIN